MSSPAPIRVEGLAYAYPDAAEPTLHGLDFAVEDGEIFGFLGPSGAGKSTTQRILIRLLRGYVGRCEVLGREVSAWGPEYLAEIGVSFELPNHYARLTARENLAHFAGLYPPPCRAPEEVLEWVGLGEAADQRVGTFSKGMKIRLNVARSVLHRPRLLFLDEPTGGLDPASARRMKSLVRHLRDEGATVFVTTHDMAVASELCDRVAFITEGRLQAIGAPTDLQRAHGRREVRVEWTSEDGPRQACFPLDGLADQPGFLAALRAGRIEAIHSQETTLEQVFIEVTGRRLDP